VIESDIFIDYEHYRSIIWTVPSDLKRNAVESIPMYSNGNRADTGSHEQWVGNCTSFQKDNNILPYCFVETWSAMHQFDIVNGTKKCDVLLFTRK